MIAQHVDPWKHQPVTIRYRQLAIIFPLTVSRPLWFNEDSPCIRRYNFELMRRYAVDAEDRDKVVA